MTQSLPQHLARLGDALHRAVAADLATESTSKRWRRPRRAAVVVVALAVAIPAAALAAQALISTGQVAQSLPQGTQALIGTDPTCTVVVANVQYSCVLANPPANPGAPAAATTAPNATVRTDAPALHARAGCTALIKHHAGKALCGAALSSAAKRKLVRLQNALRAAHLSYATRTATLRRALQALARSGAAQHITKPVHATASAPFSWMGTVGPTVDASKHVNGGCRAQNADGTDWECYIGQAAVAQNIISRGFLGQYAPVPGVG